MNGSGEILLINPPYIRVYNQDGKLPIDEAYGPPLGLAYIASVLEKSDYKVRAYDFCLKTIKDVESTLRKERPWIIGIPCFTEQRLAAFKTAHIAKSIDKDVTVILGGFHATFMYDQILRNYPNVDFIVRGEGEHTILDLIQTLCNGSNLKNVKGIAFKENGAIVKTEDRPLIRDLDSLPFPAHHLFDYKKYGCTARGNTLYPILTSRGCPFSCIYCSTSSFWGHFWRFRSPRNVVDEIEMLHEKYKAKAINFLDDTFTANQKRAIEICKEILSRGIDIEFGCITRVDRVAKETLMWLRKAGCNSIHYGVESGSPTILHTINKRFTLENIVKALEATHYVGIPAFLELMVGNPGETEKTVSETLNLLAMAKYAGSAVHLTRVYPNTMLYELAKQKGLLDDEYWLVGIRSAPIYDVENNINDLKFWRSKIKLQEILRKKQTKRFAFFLFKSIFLERNLHRHVVHLIGNKLY